LPILELKLVALFPLFLSVYLHEAVLLVDEEMDLRREEISLLW
jgi:hypothetical protein